MPNPLLKELHKISPVDVGYDELLKLSPVDVGYDAFSQQHGWYSQRSRACTSKLLFLPVFLAVIFGIVALISIQILSMRPTAACECSHSQTEMSLHFISELNLHMLTIKVEANKLLREITDHNFDCSIDGHHATWLLSECSGFHMVKAIAVELSVWAHAITQLLEAPTRQSLTISAASRLFLQQQQQQQQTSDLAAPAANGRQDAALYLQQLHSNLSTLSQALHFSPPAPLVGEIEQVYAPTWHSAVQACRAMIGPTHSTGATPAPLDRSAVRRCFVPALLVSTHAAAEALAYDTSDECDAPPSVEAAHEAAGLVGSSKPGTGLGLGLGLGDVALAGISDAAAARSEFAELLAQLGAHPDTRWQADAALRQLAVDTSRLSGRIDAIRFHARLFRRAVCVARSRLTAQLHHIAARREEQCQSPAGHCVSGSSQEAVAASVARGLGGG